MADAPSIEEVIEDFNVLKCMQCGVCSGSCPSGRQASLNVRRLVRKIGRDHAAISDESLWMCTTCYNCQERCPRGIEIVDAILAVRSIAAHEGLILERHRHVANLLQEHGHAVPIDDTHKEKRIQLGLNSLPSTVHSHADDLEDVKHLLASCGFGEITGEDEQ